MKYLVLNFIGFAISDTYCIIKLNFKIHWGLESTQNNNLNLQASKKHDHQWN